MPSLGVKQSAATEQAVDYRQAPPIILLSLNRPAYLEQVLESLRNQVPEIDERRIHLFQDGAVNAYSGIRKAEDWDVVECVTMFQKLFPKGRAHVSRKNIGICENLLRAEKFAFLTLDAPFAYFFEDDLVLSKNYIHTLDRLKQSFAKQPRIAYFNAYGSNEAPILQQEKNKHSIVKMDHMWGFALRQSHWKAMQPLLAPYYEIVCGHDYRQRPHKVIREMFQDWGITKFATSQDSAKDIATNLLDCTRISTFVCLARYIGEFGTHSDATIFKQGRHAHAHIYDKEVPESFYLQDSEIDAAILARRNEWRAEYERQVKARSGI